MYLSFMRISKNAVLLLKVAYNVPQPYFSAGLIALNNIKSIKL